jgi:hypothetical protein
MLLGEEMMKRISTSLIPGANFGPSGWKVNLYMYENIDHLIQIEDLANHLERLAKSLLSQEIISDISHT